MWIPGSATASNSSGVLGGISISVSDDDSDDLAGRMRVKIRRRRKRTRIRSGTDLLMRNLVRWWPLLVLVAAIVLLVFEISKLNSTNKLRINQKPHLEADKPVESPKNLNRLEPVTRIVGGIRQPCLKILPPEEIQQLEFPGSAEPNFPVKEVVYKSQPGIPVINVNDTLQLTEASRFNLFTGYQTFQERETSFLVNETATVHCGFYDRNGGFVITDEDKAYMQSCKAVVSTCAFGGGDDLYQPIGMTSASLKKVCYVAFWDGITRSSQELEGTRIGEDQMIGRWRIVIVRNLPFSDQRLNGKIPKMLSHRLFLKARYSIWVDSKSQFRRDPLGVLEALLWRTNSVLAISEHGARSSLYDEGKAVVNKHKATPEEVEIQLNQYRRDGFPDEKRFRGKKALSEASIIVREHTPSTNLFMCLWFNEVVRFTSRDQLSFPFVLRKLNMPGINMFPVCVRKDLVNSIGHKRKVKPLVKATS